MALSQNQILALLIWRLDLDPLELPIYEIPNTAFALQRSNVSFNFFVAFFVQGFIWFFNADMKYWQKFTTFSW